MKINTITKFLLAATLFAGVASCENPLTDFDLKISTEVIQNSATVRVLDIDGNAVPGVAVSLVSGDTEDIYNMEGKKVFNVVGNQVTFGVDPKRTVTAASPVRFRIQFTAPGFNTQTIPVTITNLNSGIEVVTLTKPVQLPDGSEQQEESVDLGTDGATTAPSTVTIPPSTPGQPTMKLEIPAGTQFKDASGAVITGGSVLITVQSLDTENENTEATLPGGSLVVDKVVLGNGQETSGTFSPAAITKINMMVNGRTVSEFSQPIQVSIPLPASYVSPATGQPLAAGQTFGIYSNSSSDNTWRFEKNVTVVGNAITGFSVPFTISHLTYYMVGEFGESCSTTTSVINIGADWYLTNQTYPLIIEAVWGENEKVIFSRQYSVSLNSRLISIDDLPKDNVKIRVKNANGVLLAEKDLAACGAETLIFVPDPSDVGSSTVTLQLYVRCPNKTTPITLLPTFTMYYKETGSTEEPKFLGEVNNGFLRTTLLKTDGTKYDFLALYGTKFKHVSGHAVTADNTATVGIQPGDIIGTKAGAYNLGLLTEECNNL